MQDADGDRLAVPGAQLESAREQRDPPELGLLGEEAADLQVGVYPGLRLPEELQQQAVAQVDRAVGLLRPERARPEIAGPILQRAERLGPRGHQLGARAAAEPPPPHAAAAPCRPPAR